METVPSKIGFLLVSSVGGLPCQFSDRVEIEWEEHGLRFVIELPKSNAVSTFELLEGQLYHGVQAEAEQISFVEHYISSRKLVRMTDELSLPYASRSGETLIAEGGSMADKFSPRRHQCPADICELLDRTEENLAGR